MGVGQWIYGFLLGWLTLLLGIYGLAGAVQLADRLFETGWTFQFTDQGWNTLITSGAFAVGLYFAGRAVPRAMSIASRRPVGELRPWVATIGTAATFAIFFFVIEMPLNWASAIGMAVVPLAFGLGAYRPHLLPSRWRSVGPRSSSARSFWCQCIGLLDRGHWTRAAEASRRPAASTRTVALGWSDHGG